MAGSSDTLGLAPVWAVVPLRGLESAKTRLAPDLDPEERLALVTEMAERTLAASRDARSLAGTVLVTLDPAAARLAAGFGALTIVQRLPGLNDAIRQGRALAIAHGARSVLVLPIDLPRVTAEAIDEVVAAAAGAVRGPRGEDPTGIDVRPENGLPRGVVAIVPDRHGSGTNALLVSPPAAVDPAFGEDSHRLHVEAARGAHVPLVELAGPLTLDVDTPSDLLDAEEATATAAPSAGPRPVSPDGVRGRGAPR